MTGFALSPIPAADVVLVMLPPWDTRTPPLGLASMVEYLRSRGRSVQPLDLNLLMFQHGGDAARACFSRGLEHEQITEALTGGAAAALVEQAARAIAASRAPVVGLSTTEVSVGLAGYLAGMLRDLAPEVCLVAGGPGVDNGNVRFGLSQAGVDYFVLGEGEVSLHALLGPLLQGVDAPTMPGVVPALHRPQFPFRPRPPADLATLPWPTFDGLDPVDYQQGPARRVALQTSRGCVASCVFCPDIGGDAPPYQAFPPAAVAGHLQRLAQQGVTHVEFTDLVINGDPEALEQWCALVVRAGAQLYWTGQFTVIEGMTPEVLQVVRRSGCIAAHIGLESGSDHVLGLMGKAYNTELASQLLRRCEAAGLQTEINLLVGFPGETEQHLHQTMDFVVKHRRYIHKVHLLSTCELADRCALRWDPDRFGVSGGTTRTDFEDREGTTEQAREERALELTRCLADAGIELGTVANAALRAGRPDAEVEDCRQQLMERRLAAHSVVADPLCLTLDDQGRNTSLNHGNRSLTAPPGLGATVELNGRVLDASGGRWAAYKSDDGVLHLEVALLFEPARLMFHVAPAADQGITLELDLLAEQPVELRRVRLGLVLSEVLSHYATALGSGPLAIDQDQLEEVVICQPPASSIVLHGEGDAPRLNLQVVDDFFWDFKVAQEARGRRLLLDRHTAGGPQLAAGLHRLAAVRLRALQPDEEVDLAPRNTARAASDRFDQDFALLLCPPWHTDTAPLWPALLAGALRAEGLQGSCHDLNFQAFGGLAPGSSERELWDPQVEHRWRHGEALEEIWSQVGQAVEQAALEVAELRPRVAAFSTTESNLRSTLRVARLLREASPETSIVLGGPGVYWTRPQDGAELPVGLYDPWTGESMDPDELVDLCLRGEGDITLPRLVRWLRQGRDPLQLPGAMAYRSGRWASPVPPQVVQDLSLLPPPDFSDLAPDSYPGKLLPLQTSRGCVRACTICNSCIMQGHHRSHDPERVAAEVAALRRRHDLSGLVLVDLVANGAPSQLGRLCDLLAEQDAGLSWTANCLPVGLDADLLERMALAGCRELNFALDSLSQPVLDSMRKGFSVDAALDCLREARRRGIQTNVTLVAGYPRETPELFDETLAALEHARDAITRVSSITACRMTYGSRLWQAPELFGMDTREQQPWHNWTGPFGNDRAERLRRVLALKQQAEQAGVDVVRWEQEGEEWDMQRVLVPSY